MYLVKTQGRGMLSFICSKININVYQSQKEDHIPLNQSDLAKALGRGKVR
ncbi:hypothetical protein NGI46_13630 [Peribacillus butanolivorans]|nr:hypothetical protein [Peribacillus butanolivorans]